MSKHDHDRSINWEHLDGRLGASTDDLMVFTDENERSGAIPPLKTTTSCLLANCLGDLVPEKSSFHIFLDENERSALLAAHLVDRREAPVETSASGNTVKIGPDPYIIGEAQVTAAKGLLCPTVSEDLSLSASLLELSLDMANQQSIETELGNCKKEQRRSEIATALSNRASEIQSYLGDIDNHVRLDAFYTIQLGTRGSRRRDPMTRLLGRYPRCTPVMGDTQNAIPSFSAGSHRPTFFAPGRQSPKQVAGVRNQQKRSERRVSFQGGAYDLWGSDEVASRRQSLASTTEPSTCSSRESSLRPSSYSPSHRITDDSLHSPASSTSNWSGGRKRFAAPHCTRPRTRLLCDLDSTLQDILTSYDSHPPDDVAPRRPRRRRSMGSRSSSVAAAGASLVGSRHSLRRTNTPLSCRTEEDGSDSNDVTLASDIVSMLSIPFE